MQPRWTRSKERMVTFSSRVDGVHLDEDQDTAVGVAIASVEQTILRQSLVCPRIGLDPAPSSGHCTAKAIERCSDLPLGRLLWVADLVRPFG